jgi:hemerythrin-like metal-binding protein
LVTGDPVVDLQHQAIHDLFNELDGAADNHSEVLRALDLLTQHVVLHFSTEEELMQRTGFPAELARVHVDEHRELTEGARQRVLEFRDGRLTSTGPLLEFLREWLTTHVQERDRELVEHVRRIGAVAEMPDAWSQIEDSPAR